MSPLRGRHDVRRTRRRLLALALALALAACDESAAPVDAGDAYDALAMIPLELGTGDHAYETVPPTGGTVELVHGPQGGYHILGRYRFRGFPPDVYVSFRVTPVEGGAPLNNPDERVRRAAPRGLVQVDGDWQNAFPELVVLTAIRSAEPVVGRTFRWDVFVRSAAGGSVATASREVTIVDDDH